MARAKAAAAEEVSAAETETAATETTAAKTSTATKKTAAESVYSIDELAAESAYLGSHKDVVRAALKRGGKMMYSVKEAKDIIDAFRNKTVN